MQLDTQEFLSLAEHAPNGICMVDIECSGLRGDYNSTLVVSIKPFGKKPYTSTVERPGEDRKLLRWARHELSKYAMWVSFYGKGFDILFLNTRLAHWGMKPIPKKPHLDLYWTARGKLLLARRSMAHISEYLECPTKKYSLSPEVWNLVLRNPKKGLPILIRRCEQDVIELEDVYKRLKVFVDNVNR